MKRSSYSGAAVERKTRPGWSRSALQSAKPTVLFIWENFGPYHVDRLEATAAALADTHRVVGIEIGESSEVYAWHRTEHVLGFDRITLFRGRPCESVSRAKKFVAMVRTCARQRGRDVFLCHYERPEIFLLALWIRLTGRRSYVMLESKFDDKPRFLLRELVKKIWLSVYSGGLVLNLLIPHYL